MSRFAFVIFASALRASWSIQSRTSSEAVPWAKGLKSSAKFGLIHSASSSVGLNRLLGVQVPAQSFLQVQVPAQSFLQVHAAGQFQQLPVAHLEQKIPMTMPVAKLPQHPDQGSCEHNLARVDTDDVYAVMNGSYKPATAPEMPPSKELAALRGQRYFIAACLHQSGKILPQWIEELIRLLLSLREADTGGAATNVFVSIYESGSTDTTKSLLEALRGHLNFLGVHNSIVSGNMYRNGTNRIEFLAKVRNKALEPLHTTAKSLIYDQVVWLNDIWYCADAVLQVMYHASPVALGGLGADAVCGMDFDFDPHMGCKLYDTWVAHDMTGTNMMHFQQLNTMLDYMGNQPFQVHSCWNGVVSFAGDLFQRHNLRFRRSNLDLHECAASESELIFHDMWNLGRGKVAMSPSASVAYNRKDWDRCAKPHQPKIFNNNSISFEPAPREVSCCPLPEGADFVNITFCECKEWANAETATLNRTCGKPKLAEQYALAHQLESGESLSENTLLSLSKLLPQSKVPGASPPTNAQSPVHSVLVEAQPKTFVSPMPSTTNVRQPYRLGAIEQVGSLVESSEQFNRWARRFRPAPVQSSEQLVDAAVLQFDSSL